MTDIDKRLEELVASSSFKPTAYERALAQALLRAREVLGRLETLLAAFPADSRLSEVRGESTILRHVRKALADTELEEALR